MKTIATFAAIAATATVAMADPNIDMSKGIANGSLGINLQSQAISGAMIQGNTMGTVTANTGAYNMSFGTGGFEQNVFLETDNAGPGVGGFGDGGITGGTFAATKGHAFADTTGVATKKGISTVAGTFGSADVSVDFGTDWTLKSDDYSN
jgi:hypothetical protein